MPSNDELVAKNWSPAQSKSIERRQSVQWKAKAEDLEGQLAAAQKQVALLCEALRGLRAFADKGLRTFAKTLGLSTRPCDDLIIAIDRILSATPAGEVVWRGQGVIDGYEDVGLPNTTRYTHISFGDETMEIIGEIGEEGMYVDGLLHKAVIKE